MTFEELAAMVKVRELALALANGPRRFSRQDEQSLRDFSEHVEELVIKKAIETCKVKYGLVQLPTKKTKTKKTSKKAVLEQPSTTEKQGVFRRVDQDDQKVVTP